MRSYCIIINNENIRIMENILEIRDKEVYNILCKGRKKITLHSVGIIDKQNGSL